MDLQELMKKAIKYIIEGLVVAICAIILPKKSLNVEEIIILGLTAAATFSILDVFVPSIGNATRNGVGFALGSNLTGGIKMVS